MSTFDEKIVLASECQDFNVFVKKLISRNYFVKKFHYFKSVQNAHIGVQKIDKSQRYYSNSKKLQTSLEKPRSVTQYPTTKKCAQMFSFVSRKNEKIQRNFSLRSINVQMMSYADENKKVSILSFEN